MNNKVLTNMNWIIIGKMIQMVLGFFVSIFSARYLGPSNYGIISYTGSYISFLAVVANLGIDDYIMKEMIDNKDNQGEVIGSGMFLRMCSSILAVIALFGILCLVENNDPLIQMVAFLQALNLIFSVGNLLSYWYQIQLRSKTTSIITTIAYIGMTIYKILILIQGKDVRFFAFSGSLETLLIVIFLFVLYKKDNGPKLSISKKVCIDLLKNSYHFILSGLMVVIFNQTDKIMLKQMMNETVVGYYSIASNLCNIWPFILSAIITSISPLILDAKKTDEDLYTRRIKQCYAAVIWTGLCISTIITILAPWLIPFLYGNAYKNSVIPLQILTWANTFAYLGVARGPWIVSEGLQKYVKYLTLSGAILNIGMNALLIPNLGAIGASIATLATQILVNFVALFFFKQLRANSYMIIEAFIMKDVIKGKTIKNYFSEIIHKK